MKYISVSKLKKVLGQAGIDLDAVVNNAIEEATEKFDELKDTGEVCLREMENARLERDEAIKKATDQYTTRVSEASAIMAETHKQKVQLLSTLRDFHSLR